MRMAVQSALLAKAAAGGIWSILAQKCSILAYGLQFHLDDFCPSADAHVNLPLDKKADAPRDRSFSKRAVLG